MFWHAPEWRKLKVIDELKFSGYFFNQLGYYSNSMGFMHIGRGSGANSIKVIVLVLRTSVRSNWTYTLNVFKPESQKSTHFDIVGKAGLRSGARNT
jgi:hypothetical protein